MNYQAAFPLFSLFPFLLAAGSCAISYLYVSIENSAALKTKYFFCCQFYLEAVKTCGVCVPQELAEMAEIW